jgi:uncharacterized membrane protein
MGAAREPYQADFDLDRFVDLFDEAMTSKDPRVVETLRKLMMIVALTRPETSELSIDRNRGPLRRLLEDVNHLNRRMHDMEDQIRDIRRPAQPYRWEAEDKYTMVAAAQMAKDIDTSIMQSYNKNINGLAIALGPENKAKGLK